MWSSPSADDGAYGNDPESHSYVRMKVNHCAIESRRVGLDEGIVTEELPGVIGDLSTDPDYDANSAPASRRVPRRLIGLEDVLLRGRRGTERSRRRCPADWPSRVSGAG